MRKIERYIFKGGRVWIKFLCVHLTRCLELRHFTSIILACICGLLIGYERKARNKQAGVKTHVIVCLTSALDDDYFQRSVSDYS